ncbi:MAG: tetratricopeptide repeat protein [Phycisphaerae bacterium]|jgi:tetratricopeptide (TPR) repeat protein|nr:tetratricopeptide repeat protein [Phycisphaerae bacterium]
MRKPVSALAFLLLPLLIVASIQSPGFSQAKKSEMDKAARRILDSARRSYSSGQFDVAAQRFSEFLKSHSTHAEIPSASYGMGLSQLKLGKHANLTAAVGAFRMPSGRMEFANRPLAIYYLGVSLRDLATSTLAQKLAAGSSDSRATYARQYRQEAARAFASAVDAFVARSSKTPAPAAPAVHPDLVWAARARSDQADVLLRLKQYKQAMVLSKATLNDKATVKQFGDRALYNMGYAHFSMKNYLAAGRALSKLAPFKQDFGPHARYLLARTHHLSGDMPEAAGAYKAILDDYTARKAAAVEAARHSYRSIPADKRAATAALATGPPAPFIVRGMFYSALLQAESGRFANALTGFTAFVTQNPKHPLAPEAQLRQGYCQLQLRSYAEAIKTLDPLRKHPKLADRASWWKARARVGSANPEVPQTYTQTLATAITELTAAATSAHNSRASTLERDIRIELGDVQQLAGKYKEAIATYTSTLQYSSDRTEEAMQRLATAYHLSGDYGRSDSVCSDFERKFPKSTLLPDIWFRRAENACMLAVHSKPSSYSSSKATIERTFKQAVNRYERLLDKFPDFSEAHLARYGLATAQYRLGWYTEAIETLSAIPAGDRMDKLGAVPYLMADCHIRTFPDKTDEALSAAKLMDQAVKAGKLLEGFVSANAKSPKVPDALLKLGYCYQRLGSVLADATAKKVAYTKGKEAYARLIKDWSKDTLVPTAVLEQAKCMVLLGDSPGALNELGRFQRDPYRSNRVAPLAIVQLSSLLRASKRAIDAARIVKECRTLHGKRTSKNPGPPSSWMVALQYEHGLAIMDTGKLAEARAEFESLIKRHPGRPEAANSLWRTGQCQRRELIAAIAAETKVAGGSAEQRSAADKAVRTALTGVGTVAAQLTGQAKTLAKTAKGSEAHLRLIYEAAWCYRILGEREIESARRKLQKDALSVSRSRRSSSSGGKDTRTLSPPRVLLEDLPIQESEAQAVKLYEKLIAAAPQSPLAARGRFELAEMFAHRRKHDQAVELLETILENNPPADLAQRARLRLAACLLDRGDPKRAMALVKLVTGKAKGEELGHARYLTGEAYILQKEWSKAIEQFNVFHGTDPYRHMHSIADRALVRLAHAYEQTGNWGSSRQAMEALASRYPRSLWINEARFGAAWARENSKDYTNAVPGYASVTANTAAGVAARAQLRLGHCYMALKKYPEAARAFLAVPYTYNYPEYNAQAWYESGVAYIATKQPVDADKSLQQVLKNYPKSKWAAEAKKLLPEVKKLSLAIEAAKKKAKT